MRKLEGTVALITGAGRGIGRAVVLKLASEGAKIVVNDLDCEPAQDVVAEVKSNGGDALAVVGSVTDLDFPDRFIGAAVDGFGGVDIIVNNAGYTMDAMIGNMTDDAFDAMYAVHLKAPFRILRAASTFILPAVKAEDEAGKIVYRKVVNISSMAGTGGNVGQANYSSMKAGVIGLTKSLAKEWGRFHVNVNCVAFGLISTRITQAADEKVLIEVEGGRKTGVGIPTKVRSQMEQVVPMGRAGTPEEAAGAVSFFCSPESNYVSGQTLVVGGGLTF